MRDRETASCPVPSGGKNYINRISQIGKNIMLMILEQLLHKIKANRRRDDAIAQGAKMIFGALGLRKNLGQVKSASKILPTFQSKILWDCFCKRGNNQGGRFKSIHSSTLIERRATAMKRYLLAATRQARFSPTSPTPISSCYHVSSSPAQPSCRQISSYQLNRDAFGRHRRLAPDCLVSGSPSSRPLDAADKALLAEYRIQSDLAKTTIDKNFTDLTGLDRSVLLSEIKDAASKQPQGIETAEIGPSGRFKYFHIDDGAGIRTFYRAPASCSDEEAAVDYLRINYHAEMPGPTSLSADEMFVARIASPALGGIDKIIVRHIDFGSEHSISIPNLDSIAFGPDGKGIYYTTKNGLGRPDSVYRISFDSTNGFDAPENVKPLFHDADERNFVEVRQTKGNRWIMIQSTSKSSNEITLVDGNDTRLVRERENGVMYFVDCGNADGEIYILAHRMNVDQNDQDNVKTDGLREELILFTASSADLPLDSFQNAKTLYKPKDNHFVEDIDVFKEFVVLYERSTQDGTHRISVCGLGDDVPHTGVVPLLEKSAIQISPGQNACFESSSFRFNVESPLHPPTALEYGVESGAYCDQCNGLNSLNFEDSILRKEFAKSADGTMIPMTLVGKASPDIDGPRPTVLVAYGAYGQMNGLAYDLTLEPLLRRNFIVAYAHTRGGGELGTKWYQKGRGLNKPRAIDDLIACADALTNDLAVTEPHLLGIKTFSAGAVIAVGAANKRPDVFSAMSLVCPFLDVAGAMSDPTLPLTEHEYDEWGDSFIIDEYCPFTNTKEGSLPPTLVVGALDDVNVPYWHASTYAMKRKQMLIEMRDVDAVDDQLHPGETHLKIEESGGHDLHGRRLDVTSLESAFFISELEKESKQETKKGSLLGAVWDMIK